jgi:hypothetical protein
MTVLAGEDDGLCCPNNSNIESRSVKSSVYCIYRLILSFSRGYEPNLKTPHYPHCLMQTPDITISENLFNAFRFGRTLPPYAFCMTHNKNAELHLCLCHMQHKCVEATRQNFTHSPVNGCLVGYLSHMLCVCMYVCVYVCIVCVCVFVWE